MDKKKRPSAEPISAEVKSTAKKTYKKPSFRHEKVFETMALACGKLRPTQLQCKTIRKSS